jgi:hypothetical protein
MREKIGNPKFYWLLVHSVGICGFFLYCVLQDAKVISKKGFQRRVRRFDGRAIWSLLFLIFLKSTF